MVITEAQIWDWLAEVKDPEIPVLTVQDLGIAREVRVAEDGTVTVKITPTYSGCPAMNEIEQNIRQKLEEEGVEKVQVETILSPPWTTDWMSAEGRRKLKEYGIFCRQKIPLRYRKESHLSSLRQP
jgi:ring-1,2-phenylacetyl-CoA epoxidase subunit PaaD